MTPNGIWTFCKSSGNPTCFLKFLNLKKMRTKFVHFFFSFFHKNITRNFLARKIDFLYSFWRSDEHFNFRNDIPKYFHRRKKWNFHCLYVNCKFIKTYYNKSKTHHFFNFWCFFHQKWYIYIYIRRWKTQNLPE